MAAPSAGSSLSDATVIGEGAELQMMLPQTRPRAARRTIASLAVVGAGLALSGCLGPTYGTGQSQGEQLFNDLDGMLALGSTGNKEKIDYAPRAELVRPSDTSRLPQPRDKVDAANDPNWPESPEQRSARIKAAADAEAATVDGAVPVRTMLAAKEGIEPEQIAANSRATPRFEHENADTTISREELEGGSAEFRAKLRESRQGNPTQRKYLSEPPVAYRQAAATAPVGDVGIDESVKEARYKKGDSIGSKLRNLLPF